MINCRDRRTLDYIGCRVIVPNIADVYEVVGILREAIRKGGHAIARENDYIKEPRIISGYRSYHIIIKYCGENGYDGMFIEIQVRTELEHRWSTAVEIIDTVTQQRLKVGSGSEIYTRFFKLVSGLFSIDENSNLVSDIPISKQEIVEEIYAIDKLVNIREKLSAYNSAIKFIGDIPRDNEYYLLITDMRRKSIRVTSFEYKNIETATKRYQLEEQWKEKKGIDAVLVAARKFKDIQDSYPNYFTETNSFLKQIDRLCMEYPEKASINFDTNQFENKIETYFKINYYDKNIPKGSIIGDDYGIEATRGDIIYCEDEAISQSDAYLRFSGIIWNEQGKFSQREILLEEIEGPGIVIVPAGGMYYVDKERWSFISWWPVAIIQCKDNIEVDYLLYLLIWMKTNVCTWDLLWKRNTNSVFKKGIFEKLHFPRPDYDFLKKILHCGKKVLESERKCVEAISLMNDVNQIDQFIKNFNIEIVDILCEIERRFDEYLGVSESEQKVIAQELQLKGYYVYENHT